jgi:hypothetical protein
MHPATRDSAIVCARINHDVAAAAATNTRLFRFLMIREVRIKRDIPTPASIEFTPLMPP